MERAKRSESPVWRNPCGFALSDDQQQKRDPQLAESVWRKTAATLDKVDARLKDPFTRAKLQTDFESGLQMYSTAKVLEHPWFALPPVLGHELDLMAEHSDYYRDPNKQLPGMYKTLELVLGAMETIPDESQFTDTQDDSTQEQVRQHLDIMRTDLRTLLCNFELLLMNWGIEKLPSLEPHEVPIRPDGESMGNQHDFLVFRDTVNFVHVLKKYFEKIMADEATNRQQ